MINLEAFSSKASIKRKGSKNTGTLATNIQKYANINNLTGKYFYQILSI